MTFAKWIAAGSLVLAMGTGSALAADECTDAMLTERQGALGKWLQEHPDKAEKVGEAVATVEKKYGGEPPREKQCDALDELMEEVKKL